MAKLLVIIGFVIAFAAGLTVGLATRTAGLASLASPSHPAPTTRPGPRHGARFLIDALNLTPRQSEQLSRIWSGPPHPHDFDERRGQIRRDRDQAILALVPDSDKSKYDKVQQTYRDQIEAVNHELRASFDNKVELTKQILTLEQRTKYEEILKQHQADRGARGRSGPHSDNPSRRDGDHATSRPASALTHEAP